MEKSFKYYKWSGLCMFGKSLNMNEIKVMFNILTMWESIRIPGGKAGY